MSELIYSNLTQPSMYDGASLNYRRGLSGLYQDYSGTPDLLAAKEVQYLRMRSAHAIRNNGYAQAALNKYVTSLGTIKVNWKTVKGEKHELMQILWDDFCLNPSFDNYGNFLTLQTSINKSLFSTGASYIQLLIQRRKKGNIPLKLKLIPTELHNIFYRGKSPEDKIINGIRFSNDLPISYFFNKSVYELELNQFNSEPREVSAKDLIHVFHRDYPGQWIGVPKLSSCLLTLFELDDLTDATIAKQKAAQAISWIIENTNPMSMTGIGAIATEKDMNDKDKIVFKSQGGNVQYLNKGEKIHFYQSTDIGPNLQSLIKSELEKIAVSIGIPYHDLTGDTSGLDFSSIRAVGISLRNYMIYLHHVYNIPCFFDPLTSYFKNLSSLYYNVEDAFPSYQLPRYYGVDELKDTQADLLEVRNGMATLDSKLDERHTTREEIIEDAKKNKELEEFGIFIYGNNKNDVLSSQNENINPNSNSTGN